MHDLPLITTLAVGFVAAWVLGLLTQRLGFSPIVGYLLAGICVGPYTPGIEADREIAHELAEVGVILLMFGVGLHFHLKDLLAVKSVAVPGAVGQSIVATALGLVAFTAFGFEPTTATVLGMAMAVASTVVLMRVLMDAEVLESPQGHIAVGWLLVEDVFTVIVLVLIPVLDPGIVGASGEAAQPALWQSLGVAFLKLGILVAIVALVGARVVPWVLVQVARLRSRELFTLTVLVFSISMAAASYAFFGASMALGAFLAGMVVAQSPVSHQAAADALPMRDAFAVIFFVSVGMLFDPLFLLREPLMVLTALGIILIAKPLAALVIVALLGRPTRTALTVALGLAQIGEFSFILSDLARKHNLMTDDGHNVLIASAIISITLNPLLFRWLVPIENWLRRHPRMWKLLNGRAERRTEVMNLEAQAKIDEAARDNAQRHAVVVGFGPVGRSVNRLLTEAGIATVVIDMNMFTVSQLNASGQHAIYGDATHESILEHAGMKRASYLVLTLPHTSARVAVVTAARNLNENARIFVRAHYLSERDYLEDAGATAAVFEEGEAAVALTKLVLADTGVHRDDVERHVRDLRLQLILENVTAIRTQRVRSMMIPWPRVRTLAATYSRSEVLQHLAQHPHTHWAVVDPRNAAVIGYVRAKDFSIHDTADDSWLHLVRRLSSVRPDDDIETVLLDMRNDRDTVRMVEQLGEPIGLVTLDDILDHVVGRVRRQHPHEAAASLKDALAAGGVVLDLTGNTVDAVIMELAAAIPAGVLPANSAISELALRRERDVSTDLGVGVAIPHARCPHLTRPVVVFGRAAHGVAFSEESMQPVRLVFLVVTPQEQPDTQLALLAQLSQVVANHATRNRLLMATTASEVVEAVEGR